jgi:hypothetical protein
MIALIGVIMTMLIVMTGVPASATTYSTNNAVRYQNVMVGTGYAGIDQLYWRTSGNQWAVWYLRSNSSTVDNKTRGMYGSFFASHTEYRSHETLAGDVWSRVAMGKTIETSRVKGNSLIQPTTGYSYSTNAYGPENLYVSVKECVDVIAFPDSCTSTFTTYNATFKG